MSEYRRGQEVEVSYRARVVETIAGSPDGTAPALRLEPIDRSHHSPPGGWVDPSIVNVKVLRQPLPTAPGIYWKVADDQKHMGDYHTDGREYHYLNSVGLWVDIGWGGPHESEDGSKYHGPLVQAGPDLTSGS